MTRKRVDTKKAPSAIGPYSQGIGIENPKQLYFFSGQIAICPESGHIESNQIKDQTKQVLENIGALLKEIGADYNNIAKTTIFLKDLKDFSIVNEIYASYFSSSPPARSTVEVSRLPKDALIEIESIVVL